MISDSGGSYVVLQCNLTGVALAETLDGGQCFRWDHDPAGLWRGICGRLAVEMSETPSGLRTCLRSGGFEDLNHHLATDIDWFALADRLPWRTDEHMARCVQAFPGLRILRQPVGETLLCFLCSATKQIVQIKQMAEALAHRFGRMLAPGIHALPTWERLARASESELRGCQLGFRARYVAEVAQGLKGKPGWLDATAAMPYPEAKARLMELPGVGAKIADCVLLFGAGMLEAFPVDIWLTRAMSHHYGLEGWSPAQIAHFGRAHFGPLAGLAQQYLFAWERRHSRRA